MSEGRDRQELSPKELRRMNYEAMQKKEVGKREEDIREEFRKYFVKVKRKLNLDPQLEDIIWLHFKASGFNKKEKFDEGIKHFGYRI